MQVFTGADCLALVVYRGPSVAPAELSGRAAVGSSVVRYGAGTLSTLSGSSSLVGFATHMAATDLATAPAGMTNLASTVGPPAVVAHEAAARTTNWPDTDVTVSTSGTWFAWVVEVKDAGTQVASLALVGNSFDYPAGTIIGDLVVVAAWQYGGTVPPAPVNWDPLGSSSGAAISTNVYWRLVPYVPEITHLMP